MRTKENMSVSLDHHESAGRYLKALREESNATLQDVCEATRVSVSNLKALEAQNYDKLPADIFVKGHLNLYGDYLGIDGKQLAARFFAERDARGDAGYRARQKLENHKLDTAKLAEPSHIPPATVASILLALILVSFTVFCLKTSWNPFSFVTVKTRDLSSTVMDVFQPSPTVTPTIVQGESIVVRATFNQEADVKIAIDNQAQDQTLFQKDQQIEWEAVFQLRLEVSPPDSAAIILNGKEMLLSPEHNGMFLFQRSISGE